MRIFFLLLQSNVCKEAGRNVLDVKGWNLKLEWRQVSSGEPLKRKKYSVWRKQNLSSQSRSMKADTEVCMWEQQWGHRERSTPLSLFLQRKEYPPNSSRESRFSCEPHMGLIRRNAIATRAYLFGTPLVSLPLKLQASFSVFHSSPKRRSMWTVGWSRERNLHI